jgi:hypothetical protein
MPSKLKRKRNKNHNIRRKLVLQNIRSYLAELKSKTPCADCNHVFHPVVMDFDHVRGVKVIELSDAKSWPKVFEEIPKCDIVCSNCHRIRTFTRSTQAKVKLEDQDPQLTFTF